MGTSVLFLVVFAFVFAPVHGDDPGSVQDFCVAIQEPNNGVFVNGKFCKKPNLATPNDFLFTGLQVPRTTSNRLGFTVTPVFADQLPGLNTLGISLARVDFGIGGLVPPHTHHRGSEIILVLEGILYVGFVTSEPGNRLFAKVLYPGDVFVFPVGLIHFQLNVGKTPAVSISSLSSQNPGFIIIANALFNATVPISPEVLSKALRLNETEVEKLQKDFRH